MMKKLSTTLLVMALSFASFARELSVEQKLADFDQLKAMISSGYGPIEYKKTRGMDFTEISNRYREIVSQTENNRDFYYSLVKYVAEFNDSHFGIRVPTDHKAKLNFSTDYIQGKVLIDKIDRTKLSKSIFPFEKGDEILEIGGEDIQSALAKIIPYMGQGNPESAKRKAAMLIPSRPGSVLPVPTGEKVTLKIRRGDSNITQTVELSWVKSGTPLDEYIAETEEKFFSPYVYASSDLNYDLIALDKEDYFENDFRCSGKTRTAIPDDATIIMKKPFVAYYHPSEKGNIGYLRLPHYSPKEANSGVDPYEVRFAQYEYAVNELEKNTVGLIIDQNHNCGGSVSYLHKILSLFVNQPFPSVQFELLASKESYLRFKNWTDTTKPIYQHSIEFQEALEVLEIISKAWSTGDSFLTPKVSLSAPKTNFPHHINYTKPIIVLIDELSGSGGDAFPAMMQGLGRAKLLGTRTMGAGGHVVSLPELGNSRMSARMTKSLFYHPNGTAIENNGASPDIEYLPTREDFLYEYRNHQTFYLQELFKLIDEAN